MQVKLSLGGFANNKGADQISTFVIGLLLTIIAKLDSSEISIF